MSPNEVPVRLHLALERLSSLFRSQVREAAVRHDLKLVQLEALIYLGQANRYSDTAGALADYLGVTKGTTSQTLMALERRALITKSVDDRDGRVIHCTPTEAGHAVLAATFPAAHLTELRRAPLEAADRAAIGLLRALQNVQGFRTFGQCHTCRHFQSSGAAHACGLTKEDLSEADSVRICREHSPSDAPVQGGAP